MLKQILAQFAASDRPLCAADVGQMLGVESRAMEGMLATLARAGRLEEVAADVCGRCPVRGACFVMGERQGPHYRLAQSAARRMMPAEVARAACDLVE